MIAASAALTGTARADDDCFVPMRDWQPREAVSKFAQEKGWTVLRIKIHDGCYEVIGQTAEGQPIEVTLHPATLQVLDYELRDRDHKRREGRHGEKD
nr:PepSY domain-containing protein [Roseibium litorale]